MRKATSIPYPNRLREFRLVAALSRAQLAVLTDRVAESDPDLFRPVSARSMERLERGEVKPQGKTAHAMAKALNVSVADIFPLGISDPNMNPTGNTTIDPTRPRRGPAKQK